MKKVVKFLAAGLLLVGVTSLSSCKKEDMSKYVTYAQLDNYSANSEAKVFNYNLTFAPGSTFELYEGITGFQHGDVIITYMLYEDLGTPGDPDYFWVQLPFYYVSQVNIFAEYAENDGSIFVIAEFDDGSAPWSTATTISLKSVLIKANAIKAHPNVNFKNYKEVEKAFNLKQK